MQRRGSQNAAQRKNIDFGRFNLWRPIVVDGTGGSKWNRALPGGSKWVQALPARGGNADRSFPENSGKPEKLGTPIYGSQFRRQIPR